MTLLQINLRSTILIMLFFLFKIYFESKITTRLLNVSWVIIICSFLRFDVLEITSSFFYQNTPFSKLSFNKALEPIIKGSKDLEVFVQNSTNGFELSSPPTTNLFASLRYGWLTFIVMMISISLLLFYLGHYLLLTKEFKFSLPASNKNIIAWKKRHRLIRNYDIRYYDQINSPLTYGFFRPIILIPKRMMNYSDEELYLILKHEYTHIKHLDSVTSLTLLIICCFNWFNPFSWLFFSSVKRDLETICDESVLKGKTNCQCKQYASLLIRERAFSTLNSVEVSHFARSNEKKRIKNIMYINQKKNKKNYVLFFLFLIMLSITSLTYTIKEKSFITLCSSYTVEEDGVRYTKSKSEVLTQEEFEKSKNITNMTWWSYEEYEQFLKNEKIELNELMRKKIPGFSEKEVNETIYNYEKILTNISKGVKFSKSENSEEQTISIIK